ncbi:TetR/AcrR family transcriptional regulator [Agaribacter marinus]|uniref:TetR/AcrR family transcriptional regulator n=1 Tax=Agaribacter marinus TaxID=1431249 RepID=UPI0024E136AF|nr:TetR/AcrR family transcriptional regulator [Agaribacter marinus]
MKYNHTEAIEKATQLFWQKGFQASGMRDIQHALDMRPGSIYARFKSKDVLFQTVVEQYNECNRRKLVEVANAVSPINALREFIITPLTGSEDKRYARQCLLVKTIPELDLLGINCQQVVMEGITTSRECFILVIESAIDKNELPANTPVSNAADWLMNQFIGLRAYASINDDDMGIKFMVDKLFIDLTSAWPETQALSE